MVHNICDDSIWHCYAIALHAYYLAHLS
jgi:hypothetical protein